MSRSIRHTALKAVPFVNLWILEIARVTAFNVCIVDMGTHRIGLPHRTMLEDLAILKIKGCTPYPQVKTILLGRFHRRLEGGQPATVPGRTLETVVEMCPPSPP